MVYVVFTLFFVLISVLNLIFVCKKNMTEDFVYNPPLFPFLDVLYEDDDIMVVNKPSGLLSVPGRLKEHHDSILSRIKSSYPDAFAVHRLDMGDVGSVSRRS